MTHPRKGQVILFNDTHPSHSWQNGLYIVKSVNKRTHTIMLNQLRKDGSKSDVESGVGYKDNPKISITKLIYKF